jgi:hypothetical protein
VASTETTIFSYTVPAGLLANEGDAIRVTIQLVTSNTSGKTMRWKWDGVVIDSAVGTTTGTNNFCSVDTIIRQASATTQRVNHYHLFNEGANTSVIISTAPRTANLANPIVFAFTGQCAIAAAITGVSMQVEFLPAP